MIYFNGEELDTSNTTKDYKFKDIVKDYDSYISSLKSRFGTSVIYITRQQPRRDKKTGNLRPVPLKSWPKTQSGIRIQMKGQDRPMGPFSMVWNNAQVEMKNKMPILDEKNFLVKEGSMSIDLNINPDMAYFMQFHNVVRSGEFYIYDPATTARTKADKYRLEQKVRGLLFNENSPLHKNEENLYKVARRWGLADIDQRSPDEITVELFEKVMGNQDAKKNNPTLRGVKEFLEDTQLGAGVKAGELVSRAEVAEVLTYNKTHSEYQLIFPGRQAATTFFSIPADKIHRMRDFLIEALVMDDQLMRKLESALGIELKDTKVDFDIEKLDSYKFQELQSIAASLSLKAIGIKQAVLKQNIKEAYQAGVS